MQFHTPTARLAKPRIAVLVSGGGRTLQNLIDCINGGSLAATIDWVIASRPGMAAIDRARGRDIACDVLTETDSNTLGREIFTGCDERGIDLVVMGGWLRLVHVPPAWFGRVINIHPSLLPDFGGPGMFGRRVHDAVLASGATESGCTVHFVDNQFDHGPIILQRRCPVRTDDTPDSLAARVFEQEKLALPEAIRLWAAGRLSVVDQTVRIDADLSE